MDAPGGIGEEPGLLGLLRRGLSRGGFSAGRARTGMTVVGGAGSGGRLGLGRAEIAGGDGDACAGGGRIRRAVLLPWRRLLLLG